MLKKKKKVIEDVWFRRVRYAKLEPNQYLCSAVHCRIGSEFNDDSFICQICSDLEDEEDSDMWNDPNYHTYVPI